MTRYIKSDYNQFVAGGSSTTLHTGVGKILAMILTTTNVAPETTTIYDNTAAAGNVLLTLNVTNTAPVFIIFPPKYPPVFKTGLTIVTAANTDAFIITEA
ncbi:hypothetical protein ACFLZW_05680 [Chloroflexota bacterium]